MNSKLLKSCSCDITEKNTQNFGVKPYVYISNTRSWASNYRFHYTHEHTEELVSRSFFGKFVVSIIDILSAFDRHVKYLEAHLIRPNGENNLISEKIILCWGLLATVRKENSEIDKKNLIRLIDFLIVCLDIWEDYVLKNGIDRFF